MGFKKITDLEQAGSITSDDTVLVVHDGETARCTVEQITQIFNGSVKAIENTDDEGYTITFVVGDSTVTTPNLAVTSITSVAIQNGHLIVTFSDDTTLDAGIINTTDIPQYGVAYNLDTMSPILERVGAATGLVANVGKGTQVVNNDFDNIYPWCDITKCILDSNGNVIAYKGDANYVEDGSLGQVMVEIPKFYIKKFVDESDNKLYTYICREKLDSNYRLPKPFVDENGDELDYIYIAAYLSASDSSQTNGTDVLSSKNIYNWSDGKQAMFGYYTFADAINAARALNEYDEDTESYVNYNWHLFDITEYSDVILPLFFVEFANLNSDSILPCYVQLSTRKMYTTSSLADEEETQLEANYFYTSFDYSDVLEAGTEICVTSDSDHIDEETDDFESYVGVRKVTAIELIEDVDGTTGVYKVTISGSDICFTTGDEWYGSSDRPGVTSDIVASSGYTYGLEEERYFTYRGLEVLYGWDYTFLGGVYTASTYYYATSDITKHGGTEAEFNANADYYVAIPKENATTSGYVSALTLNEDAPWVALPSAVDGVVGDSDEDNVGYCDYLYNKNTTAKRLVIFGGSGTPEGGICSFYLGRTVSYSYYSTARLSYRSFSK